VQLIHVKYYYEIDKMNLDNKKNLIHNCNITLNLTVYQMSLYYN